MLVSRRAPRSSTRRASSSADCGSEDPRELRRDALAECEHLYIREVSPGDLLRRGTNPGRHVLHAAISICQFSFSQASAERLLQIREQIINGLDADRQSHEIRGYFKR